MNMKNKIKESLEQSIKTKQLLLSDAELLAGIEKCVDLIVTTFKCGKGLLLCGNGGSAADAQHIAAEFEGRFYYDRPPLRAEAITTNTSALTCIGNDYGFEHIFSRAVRGKGLEGDVLLAISTSGNSKNVILAAQAAQEIGMKVISLTGDSGGELKNNSDITLQIPSKDTPRIQECHITIGHIICELVEATLFPKK